MKKDITLDDLLVHASVNKDKIFNLECSDSCLAADLVQDWMDGYYQTCRKVKVPEIFGDFCKYCVQTKKENLFTGKQLRNAIEVLEESNDILKAFEATK